MGKNESKNYKCLMEGCSHVTTSNPGLCTHLRTKHSSRMVRGDTCEYTDEGPTRSYNRTPKPPTGKQKKNIRKLMGVMGQQELDIPCRIRISVNSITVQPL